MPSLSSMLRHEITRLARRESRAAIRLLQRELAVLKRQVSKGRVMLERAAREPAARGGRRRASQPDEGGPRLSPKSIRSHRKRLGLSQADMARITGVTPVAVYFWESGRTLPRGPRREALLELRSMGRRDVKRRLEEIAADPPPKTTRRRKAKKSTRRPKATARRPKTGRRRVRKVTKR